MSTQALNGIKRSKFVELAEHRTKKAIKAIRLLGYLGGGNRYEYNDVDVDKIFGAIGRELEDVRAKLVKQPKTKKSTVEFQL